MKKKTAKRVKTDAPFKDDVQQAMLSWLDDEFTVAKKNMESFHADFDEFDDLIHCQRDPKEDYEPDIFLPEFTSRLLAQVSDFVARYFASRDLVDTACEFDNPVDVGEAKASKKLLNYLLNAKDAYYYHKLLRLIMTLWPNGFAVIKGGYEQEVVQELVGYEPSQEYALNESGDILATDGLAYNDPYTQQPLQETTQKPVYQDKVVKDTPTFDLYPIQNVFYDNKYDYTLQTKDYVIFKDENKSLDDLRKDAGRMGYFNLDRLEQKESEYHTQNATAGDKTYNKDGKFSPQDKTVSLNYTLLERWGKWFVVVQERDEQGKPLKYKPGIDREGNIDDKAEHLECIITYAVCDVSEVGKELIRFQVSPHSKRPMVRFLCYVDAIRDSGFGDGETCRELQVATNDTFNLSLYRTMLATKVGFKGKRWAGIDENVKVTPERAVLLENVEDLVPFEIRDDIQGGMYQMNTLSDRMDDAMGSGANQRGMPADRRETATVGSIMERRAEMRIGLKSTTLEYIGFTEFYDMLLTLCNDFMLPQTLANILGPDVQFYNPGREDKFIPVSQSLETEESKNFKVKMWDQVLGRIVNFPNPKTAMAINYILGQILETMGGDFKHFKKWMLEENPEANMLYMLATGSSGGAPTANMAGGPGQPSNQRGFQQSGQEQMARRTM